MKFRTSSIFGGAPLIYDRFGLPGVVWQKRLGEVSLQPCRRIAASRQ
ncbi:hypothetical protein K4L04_18945 (plasmid) [Phaeobacter inhibens]|nr:hypothetical protein [Phaeobacter inhibens]UWR78254.1 hypothetical protein K4L04_18945 [Phaeobacter inhibens]